MIEMPQSSPPQAVFHKVAKNLYRLESSGKYYALFKRAGKQIRKSLNTTDLTLARRRLGELGKKVARLNTINGARKITFADLAKRWLDNQRAHLKEKTTASLASSLNGLLPYFGHVPIRNVPIRNVGSEHCEAWLTGRGKGIAPATYKHERRRLIAVLDYAMLDGLILASDSSWSVWLGCRVMTRNGNFTMSAAFNSAAETWCKMFDGAAPVRAGVAVNSTMHESKTFPSVAKLKSVRALCASSTMTMGCRRRSMLTSDGFGFPSAPGCKRPLRQASPACK